MPTKGEFMPLQRREFLKFLGAGSVAAANVQLFSFLPACATAQTTERIQGLGAIFDDDLVLLEGLNKKLLISWQDPVNANEKFGFNCDYIAFLPTGEDEGLLWVNHEYVHPVFVSGNARTKENVDKERKEVGGSIIKVKKVDGEWSFVENDPLNRRIDATTKIPFSNGIKIKGQDYAIGTLGNCAGGYTPWGTFLTAEENYDMFYGERKENGELTSSSRYNWQKFYPENLPEHYGWIVEVDPFTGKSKKLVGLGRCAHECATVVELDDGRVVAYTGDDKNFEHLYRFVGSKKQSLDEGTLYVAKFTEENGEQRGEWISMDYESNEILKANFENQVEVLTYARKAAKLLGATPLDRPEDIKIHPETGDVYVALTNNKAKRPKNLHGSIRRIMPDGKDHESNTFSWQEAITGKEDALISCPDNLAFDRNGNLWIASDISGSSIGNEDYKDFGNNGLFVVPVSGDYVGKLIKVASAPKDAELTGIFFDPEYKNLFLSVQHPGEETRSIGNPTSMWPHREGDYMPRPSVVVLSGPLLEAFTQ